MDNILNNSRDLELFLQCRKQIQSSILLFISKIEDVEEHFDNIIKLIQEYEIAENPKKLKEILLMIVSISNNSYRNFSFFSKIEQIIVYFKEKIIEYYTNTEIFNIFMSNKCLLLFLIEEKILLFNIEILQLLFENKFIKQNYILYFYPEIKIFLNENIKLEDGKKKDIEIEVDFLEKRKIGENGNILCEIIREDRINDFISYVEECKLSLSETIIPSIFETNSFLLKNIPSLIEYSAFFGSIHIFQYLINNGAEITPCIWNYAIHGGNLKIIEIIKAKHINPINNVDALIESIKCYNYCITEFILEKYFLKSQNEQFIEVFNKHCLKFYNFIIIQHSQNSLNLIDYINSKYFEKLNTFDDSEENIIENSIDTQFCLYDLLKNFLQNFKILQVECNNQKNLIDDITEKYHILENENKELKNQNKYLRLRKSYLDKKIKKLNNQINLLIGKLKKTNSKLNELYITIKSLSKIEKDSSDEIEYGPENLTPSLILEIVKNSKINMYCRRYSQAFKDICFMLYINSNITYKLLRKFIPLPNPDNLRKEYKTMIKSKEDNLLNERQIKYLLEELKGEMSKDENKPIIATISFDAATIDPENQGSNGLFVFNYQPLQGDLPTKVVNLVLKDNGKADDEILQRVKEIAEAGKEVNIIFRFVASDSDPKTNILHNRFIDYINTFQGNNFDELLDYVDDYPDLIPISDWLHLCKNLRSRFATQKILLFKGSDVIDPKRICQELDLDPKILAAVGRESMRDDLALKLINFDSLKKLSNFEEYCCLVLLLPFVLFTDVLQSTKLSIEARKQLCFISYEILTLLANESKGIQTVKSRNSDKVGYLRNTMRERTQNTILGFAYALKYYGKNLMTSRLGTHIVEYIFGHMRNGCNGYDVLDKCVYQLVKAEVTKEILEKYGKEELPIAGRSHPGGACFSEQWNIDIDDEIEIEKVPIECIQLIHGNLKYQDSNIMKLITYLSEEAPTKVPQSKGTISSARIHARQIHYSKKQ